MTIKAILSKYRLQDDNGDPGDGGKGGGGGDEGDPGNKDNKNNKDDNLISHDKLWDASTNTDNSGGKPDPQQQQQQQQQQPDPNEVFNKHIDSLDFAGDIDLAAGMTAIQENNTEAFGKLIQQIGANAYRNAIVDANKVVQQRVDKMADAVKSEVSNTAATSELVKEMNSQLPFTKNPAFAPVAQLTLTQFIEKGVPPSKAIQEVGKYFTNLSGEVIKLNPNPPSGRPAGNLGGTRNDGAGNSDENAPDWFEMLGGIPES